MRATAKYLLRDYRGAILDLNKEIALGPKYYGQYSLRADCKLALRQYKDAINDYSIAIEIAKKDQYSVLSFAFEERGYAKSQFKDYLGAIADYTEAISYDPGNSQAYFYRGWAKLSLGKKDDGCLDLSKAGELGYSEAYNYIRKYCN